VARKPFRLKQHDPPTAERKMNRRAHTRWTRADDGDIAIKICGIRIIA
jgi:hypothetical protein